MKLPARLILLLCLPLATGLLPAADSAPAPLVADTFTLADGRVAEAPLKGQTTEVGGVGWRTFGELVFTAEGQLTSAGEGAALGIVELPRTSGPITLSANLNPAGTGFAALAFMTKGDTTFWSDIPLWVALSPKGRCDVRTDNTVVFTDEAPSSFKPGEANLLELTYDPSKNTAALKLNGEVLAESIELGTAPTIGFAGFRLHESIQPGVPTVDDFAVSEAGGKADKPSPNKSRPQSEAAPAREAPEGALVSDSFDEATAGSPLKGRPTENGGSTWEVMGSLVVNEAGALTPGNNSGSTALVRLPTIASIMTMRADINPRKAGFTALSFMERGDLGFWKDATLWATLWPSGKVELRARNMEELLFTVDKAEGFKKDAFNRLELAYDATGNTVNLYLNSLPLVTREKLDFTPAIAFAGLHFQDPLTAGLPQLDNFTVYQGAFATVTAAPPAPDPTLPPQPKYAAPTQPIPELIGQPLWDSDVVTAEPVLFVDSGQGPRAKLLFPPTEILAIQSSTRQKTYAAAEIQVAGNELSLPTVSKLPFLALEELFPTAGTKPGGVEGARGERAKSLGGGKWLRYSETPESFLDQQVVITYRHRGAWTGPRPVYAKAQLARTLQKLSAKEPLKILILGDSISQGCNASAQQRQAPFLPPYPWLVMDGLKRAYRTEAVEIVNISKGGQVASYGNTQVKLLVAQKPDLVILAFGVNDGSAKVPADEFGKSIERTVREVRKSLPETDFILVSSLVANPEWTASAPELYPQYLARLKAMEGPGIAVADMTTLWAEVLKTKSYADFTANGVNHPNDFGHRLYAQTILGLLVLEETGTAKAH